MDMTQNSEDTFKGYIVVEPALFFPHIFRTSYYLDLYSRLHDCEKDVDKFLCIGQFEFNADIFFFHFQ